MILNVKGQNSRVNRITTIHGKKNIENYLNKAVVNNSIIAVNKTKADKLFSDIGIQSPKSTTIICFDNSIAYSMQNVKMPKEIVLQNTTEIEKADKLYKDIGHQLPKLNTVICFDNSIAYSMQNVKMPKEIVLQNTTEKENPMKNAEMSMEQNYNSIDGIINNLPIDTDVPERTADVPPEHSVPDQEYDEIVPEIAAMLDISVSQVEALPNELRELAAAAYINNADIGNTEYRYIPDKTYHTSGTDISLRVAQELEREGIQFSGNVYKTGKTTLTVSKPDYKRLIEIEKEVVYARKHTYNDLINQRSEITDDEIQHSEDKQQLLDSRNEHGNTEIENIAGNRTIRTDAAEIYDGEPSGNASGEASGRNTVPLSEQRGERMHENAESGRTVDSQLGQGVSGGSSERELHENGTAPQQRSDISRGDSTSGDSVRLNIVGNTEYRDISNKIYYNNVITEELYTKYVKPYLDDSEISYSGKVSDGMVTFTVSAESAQSFEKFMEIARNLYIIESSMTEKGFSDSQIAALHDHTVNAASLGHMSYDSFLKPEYSNEQLSQLAEKSVELKRISNVFSKEYAEKHDEITKLASQYDIGISLDEKDFSNEQKEHIMSAVHLINMIIIRIF